MADQIFFLGTRCLGRRSIPSYADKPGLGLGVQNSYALVCSKCVDVWARILHNHPAAYCQIVQRACPKHSETLGDGFLSTAAYKWPEALEISPDWPIDALKHDLQVALSRVDSLSVLT